MGRVPAWLGAAALIACGAWAAAGEVRFRKVVVDKAFRSEGAAVSDVNRDGRADILAGDVWYEAPDWKLREITQPGKYDPAKDRSRCYLNFAQDVNGDGWVDSIVIGPPGSACLWFENPGGKGGHWKQRTICDSACNETPHFVDLLGTGRAVLVFATGGRMAWFAAPGTAQGAWQAHAISQPKAPGTDRYSHGLGVGDLNGDGRRDVLITAGWWEAPEDRAAGPWTFHPAKLGAACADMHVYDVDGDGDADVISSSAHAYGIWWFEQVRGDKGAGFKQHLIHKAFSQTHALRLVDIDGDGLKDLVTGKRYWAHRGKDPGAKEPAVLCWFQLRRPEKGKVEFVPHPIDDDSGVGLQFEAADVNGDGRADIVTSNKKGVHLFLQERPGQGK
jgi:hypothetical protein